MRGWQLCRGKQEKKCKGWKGWRVYKQEKLRVGKRPAGKNGTGQGQRRGEQRERIGRWKANSKSRGVLILVDRNFRKSDTGRSKVTRWLQTHILSAPYLHSVSTLSPLTPTLKNHFTKALDLALLSVVQTNSDFWKYYKMKRKTLTFIFQKYTSDIFSSKPYYEPETHWKITKFTSIWREPPVRVKSLDCVSAAYNY